MSYLFTRGINDENLVEPMLSKNGRISLRIDGSSGVFRHMQFSDDMAESIVFFGKKVRQDGIRYKLKPTVVFNEITDPDSHVEALRRCESFCDQLGVPVINHPAAIRQTTRDRVATLLQGIPGVTMPATVRCAPKSPDEIYAVMKRENLEYPVIVRLAGVHGGVSSVLITSNRDRDKLHVYPFDGRDFYLTQFVDYQDPDGLYRKYRLVIVGNQLLIRHALISDQWMVHASSKEFARQRPELWAERERRVASFETETEPKIQQQIRQITQRIKLDYFGIDCNIDNDGKMLIFEVNANMNILLNPKNEATEVVRSIKAAIARLLESREHETRGAASGQ